MNAVRFVIWSLRLQQTHCLYTYIRQYGYQIYAADNLSGKHFQTHFFEGALKVKRMAEVRWTAKLDHSMNN